MVEGRNRAAAEASRRLRAEARRERDRREEALRREADTREAALRAALARSPDAGRAAVRRFLDGRPAGQRTTPLRDLLEHVEDRAPRLVTRDELLSGLAVLAEVPWVRPLAGWRPSGKSPESVFFSLAEHLLARYPMPRRLWTALLSDHAAALVPVVADVAGGGSLFRAAAAGRLSVPLTRKMCHEVMAPGGESLFLRAVRRAQVTGAGGGARLLEAWMRTLAGGRLHDRAGEVFWSRALAWFGANPMLSPGEVGPLVDYIEHRRAGDPAFSLEGRSALALMRAMHEWHRELARAEASADRVFTPSGLRPMDLDRSRRSVEGGRIVEVWRFREILDASALADEGRAMGHCVFSYARSIESGECAIWTQTLEDGTGRWRSLTIEVSLRRRAIVQARGRFNRFAQPRERIALEAWAARNALAVSIHA